MNLGVLRGGTAINIIARECELGWEIRSLPGEDVDAILASPEGQAAIADVPKFATGGFQFMFDDEVVLIPYSLG